MTYIQIIIDPLQPNTTIEAVRKAAELILMAYRGQKELTSEEMVVIIEEF